MQDCSLSQPVTVFQGSAVVHLAKKGWGGENFHGAACQPHEGHGVSRSSADYLGSSCYLCVYLFANCTWPLGETTVYRPGEDSGRGGSIYVVMGKPLSVLGKDFQCGLFGEYTHNSSPSPLTCAR